MKSFTSFNKRIRAALVPVFNDDDDGNAPVAHLQYSGPANQYVIFNAGQTMPEVFGSGNNRVVRGYAYIDYFSKTDDSGVGSKVSQIETALNGADGFKVTQVTEVGRDEAGWYHTEFSLTVTGHV